MKTVISSQYVDRPEHYSFIRRSGLQRADFKPSWSHLINADAIVLVVVVCGLLLGLGFVGALG